MKKMVLKIFSLLLMIPSVVYADEVPFELPAPVGEETSPGKDFTIVFIGIIVVIAIIFIVTLIKNKKGRK